MQEPINQEKKTLKEYLSGKTAKVVIISTLSVLLLAIVCIFFFLGLNKGWFDSIFLHKTESSTQNATQEESLSQEESMERETFPAIADDEMRGTYIASVLNINYPSRPGLGEEQLKKELDSIVSVSRDAGLDTLFFQVRPTADSLYPSEIFPTSRYLVEKEGDPISFDSLAYLVEKAEEYNMQVVAWVNPYRVTNFKSESKDEALAALSEHNPAKLNPDWTVFYGGKLYYNPALSEVQDLICAGVREICENYAVAGVLYDDYFYPYKVSGQTFDDAKEFAGYKGTLSLEDWRRDNVNRMVKKSYETVKSVSQDLTFGISPFGIWQNSSSDPKGSDTAGTEAYSELYCDALAWVEGGYVDYLAPQIYWERGAAKRDFDTLTRWWSAQVDGTDVKLYISHAAYKVPDFALGAEEIISQISYARSYMGVGGSILYGFDDIKKNTKGLLDRLHAFYAEPYQEKISFLPTSGVQFLRPTNGLKTAKNAQFVSVASDPRYPVYSDYGKVGRTKSGFFSHLMTLTEGKNTLTFTQNGVDYSLTVTKQSGSSSKDQTLSSFQIASFSPSDEGGVYLSSGQSIPLSLTAPVGCTVKAILDGKEYGLKPTKNPKGDNELLKEVYEGNLLLDCALTSDAPVSKGVIVFTCEKNGSVLKKNGPEVFVIPDSVCLLAKVKNDYSYLKIAPDSSFYEDFTPASEGMTDRVLAKFDGYYKLSFGGYIAAENVDCFIAASEMKSVLSSVEADADDLSTRFTLSLGAAPALTFRLDEKTATVTFFETSCDGKRNIDLPPNDCLFSSATLAPGKDGTAVLSLTLRSEKNYYGFSYFYDEGKVILQFRQPSSLEEGEKPLFGKTVLLDAGHGGNDSGALGFASGFHEKDLNIAIVLELAKSMEELGATVILSRSADETVTLNQRMDLLTETNPDLSISIHHNSVDEAANANKTKGTLGLYWSPSGVSLTDHIREGVSDVIGSYDKGTRRQELALCRNYRFPQTLLEVGYICNPAEFQWALRSDYSKTVADAVAEGVLNWYRMQEAYREEPIV